MAFSSELEKRVRKITARSDDVNWDETLVKSFTTDGETGKTGQGKACKNRHYKKKKILYNNLYCINTGSFFRNPKVLPMRVTS